jgi:NAD(P)-dependent dehydrogenase (short-subunit alcohol dehydrogenase family)/Ran GTPase-activating protein (RanGAP) involved in mRNA processing and transport
MPSRSHESATPDELEPLLQALLADRKVVEPTYFPRGCLLPDGRLDLCKQALGPERVRSVTEALARNTFVTSLLVGADFIGDEGAVAIARLVEEGAGLENIFVGCNLIGPRGAEALASASLHNQHLRALWLKRNPIGHHGVQAVARLLIGSRALRTLDLVQTDLSASDLASIMSAAGESFSLERLYLGGNGLSDAAPVAALLAASTSLDGLFLGAQPLGDLGARCLAGALARNRSLSVLALPSAALSPVGVAMLVEAAMSHPSLRELSLGRAPATEVLGVAPNVIGEHGASAIAGLVRASPSLRSLDLAGASLSENGLAKLIEALEDNHQIAELRVDRAAPRLGARLKALLDRNRKHGASLVRHPDVAAIASVYRTKASRPISKGSATPSISRRSSAELPSPAEVEAATKVLEKLATNPELFFMHRDALKGLRASANRVVSGIVDVARRRKGTERQPVKGVKEVREAQRTRDRALIARTGLRRQRSGEDAAPLTGQEQLAGTRCCYVCKQPYQRLHPHYDSMCTSCGDFNFARRELLADLRGRTALLTGGRLKIGRQVALKLLRAGASVWITTRFPKDAVRRFAAEQDFGAWAERLKVVGLDLRHLPSVEGLAAELASRPEGLDILINNAAQTIRRPPEFYAHLVAGEAQLLPAELGALISSAARLTSVAVAGSSEHFPVGRWEDDGQQLDLRPENSWSLSVDAVSTLELLEVHVVNALAPFLLVRGLLPAFERSPHARRFIVNVSAMEGSFSHRYKGEEHPHTNMAKASLNMLTRTAASGLAKKGVFMNSVDTGWITNEQPFQVRERMKREYDFSPPLDEVDGAARVLEPVLTGLTSEIPPSGLFLKDYRPVAW